MSRHSIANPAQRIELTEKQEDVLRLIARGLTNAEIAARLGVTLDGVKWHVREILGKFGVDSREEAAAEWKRRRRSRPADWARGMSAALSLRWAAGTAAAAAGAIAGLAMAPQLSHQPGPDSSDVPLAAVVDSLPLTLELSGVQVDDDSLRLGLWLHGRPELGRILAPPAASIAIVDDLGNFYSPTSVARDEVNTRGLTVHAPAPAAGACSLTVTLSDPGFRTFEDEADDPRSRTASTVAAGAWSVTASDFGRVPSSFAAVDPAPRAFGPATVVLEAARQDPSRTFVSLRVIGMPPSLHLAYVPEAHLRDASGRSFAPSVGSWGNGENLDVVEFEFDKLAGPVTLTVVGVPRTLIRRADIPAMVASGSTNQTVAELEARAAAMEEAQSVLTSAFAAQPPATWTFTLP